jgi:hypothetical protein
MPVTEQDQVVTNVSRGRANAERRPGNIPTSFQKLGTAILAGYGADSFLRSVLSRYQASAASQTQSKPAPTS